MLFTPKFWYDKEASLAATSLSPLSSIYRHLSYKKIAKKPRYTSSLPVICVGNITAGGSGKTPIVQAIARFLTHEGLSPHILMRGYGGRIKGPVQVNQHHHMANDVGDEALLHAAHTPTWIARDRVKGAHDIEQSQTATTIIMDDGFQNPSLKKTMNIVVVDGALGFGNERMIPAGPLREPVHDGMQRAHALIIMGDDRHYLRERFQQTCPVFQAYLKPDVKPSDWLDKRVHGFAGIGRPEKFRQTLLSLRVKLTAFTPFADHHKFSVRDMRSLTRQAEKNNSTLVTTTKDMMRIPVLYKNDIQTVPVIAVIEETDDFKAFILKGITR